ncbi:MAG: phosphatase PAP2 family protein [Bacteroidota bacterium]
MYKFLTLTDFGAIFYDQIITLQKKVVVVLVALACLIPKQSIGQYNLNTTRETILLGTGVGLTTTGYLFLSKYPKLSDQQVADFYQTPKDFTFKFDRWATQQSSKKAKKWSDVLLFTAIVPPLVLLFDPPKVDDVRRTQGIMLLQTTLLNWGVTNIAKRTARRPRPYMYHDDLFNFPMTTRRKSNSRQSFFSGHTSTTAAFYFFTATTFSQYRPDSQWKPYVWGTSIAVPALTGFLRVKAGKHFPTDVLVGYAVGALVGVLIPKIHK